MAKLSRVSNSLTDSYMRTERKEIYKLDIDLRTINGYARKTYKFKTKRALESQIKFLKDDYRNRKNNWVSIIVTDLRTNEKDSKTYHEHCQHELAKLTNTSSITLSSGRTITV